MNDMTVIEDTNEKHTANSNKEESNSANESDTTPNDNEFKIESILNSSTITDDKFNALKTKLSSKILYRPINFDTNEAPPSFLSYNKFMRRDDQSITISDAVSSYINDNVDVIISEESCKSDNKEICKHDENKIDEKLKYYQEKYKERRDKMKQWVRDHNEQQQQNNNNSNNAVINQHVKNGYITNLFESDIFLDGEDINEQDKESDEDNNDYVDDNIFMNYCTNSRNATANESINLVNEQRNQQGNNNPPRNQQEGQNNKENNDNENNNQQYNLNDKVLEMLNMIEKVMR